MYGDVTNSLFAHTYPFPLWQAVLTGSSDSAVKHLPGIKQNDSRTATALPFGPQPAVTGWC